MNASLWIFLLFYTHKVHAWCPSIPSKRQISRARPSLDARRRATYYDDNDDDYWQEEEAKQKPPPNDFSVDLDDYDYDDDSESPQQQQGGSGVYYKVRFDGPQRQDTTLDWEEGQDGTMVLLPPSYISCPRSIIHFVGGTFFGSSPKLWYGALLEGIVRATQSVVVATPIPVTLLKNPLQHVRLSRKLQSQFENAYIDIVEDEYGEEALTQVPIIGMGHSLGSRLLTVLATLNSSGETEIPPYSAYILMSFTNYNSAASIPGIQSLLNQSKRLETNGGGDEDVSQQPEQRRTRRRRTYDDYDDDDDDFDEEWEELMQDFTQTFQKQATRIKGVLTPASKELEFRPSPTQLWKALKDDGRYTIPHTLLIQFEYDTIDQSPRLADSLLESTNLYYARLKGVHLTPISTRGSEENDDDDNASLFQLSQKASKALWKLVRGKQSSRSASELRDLRQSIARYITDVVAVSPSSSTSSTEESSDARVSTKQEKTTEQ